MLAASAVRRSHGCGSQPLEPDDPPVVPRFIEHGVSRPIAERVVIRHTYERLLDDHWAAVARDLLREASRQNVDPISLPGLSGLHPDVEAGKLRAYAAGAPEFSTDFAASLYLSDRWPELEPEDGLANIELISQARGW